MPELERAGGTKLDQPIQPVAEPPSSDNKGLTLVNGNQTLVTIAPDTRPLPQSPMQGPANNNEAMVGGKQDPANTLRVDELGRMFPDDNLKEDIGDFKPDLKNPDTDDVESVGSRTLSLSELSDHEHTAQRDLPSIAPDNLVNRRPEPIDRHKRSSRWRSALAGVLSGFTTGGGGGVVIGMAFGQGTGTVILPIIGTVAGAVAGAVLGGIIGAVVGGVFGFYLGWKSAGAENRRAEESEQQQLRDSQTRLDEEKEHAESTISHLLDCETWFGDKERRNLDEVTAGDWDKLLALSEADFPGVADRLEIRQKVITYVAMHDNVAGGLKLKKNLMREIHMDEASKKRGFHKLKKQRQITAAIDPDRRLENPDPRGRNRT